MDDYNVAPVASQLSRNIAAANDGNYIVFGNGSSIMKVNHNGSVLWDYPTGAWVSSVAMSGDGANRSDIRCNLSFQFTGSYYPTDTSGNPEMKTLLPISNTSGLPVNLLQPFPHHSPQ